MCPYRAFASRTCFSPSARSFFWLSMMAMDWIAISAGVFDRSRGLAEALCDGVVHLKWQVLQHIGDARQLLLRLFHLGGHVDGNGPVDAPLELRVVVRDGDGLLLQCLRGDVEMRDVEGLIVLDLGGCPARSQCPSRRGGKARTVSIWVSTSLKTVSPSGLFTSESWLTKRRWRNAGSRDSMTGLFGCMPVTTKVSVPRRIHPSAGLRERH